MVMDDLFGYRVLSYKSLSVWDQQIRFKQMMGGATIYAPLGHRGPLNFNAWFEVEDD